jgi:hypothetical protein
MEGKLNFLRGKYHVAEICNSINYPQKWVRNSHSFFYFIDAFQWLRICSFECVNEESERMLKEVLVLYFEGSIPAFAWRDWEKPLITSVYLAVSGSRFETGTTRIQRRSVNHSASTFGKSHSNSHTARETWREISTKICNDKRTSSAGLIIRKLPGVTSYSKYLRFLT